MADSTRDMRRSVFERELKHKFGNQKLTEITHEDLRALTDAIVERGVPTTAVHAREIVLQVYRWAIERGQKVENPAATPPRPAPISVGPWQKRWTTTPMLATSAARACCARWNSSRIATARRFYDPARKIGSQVAAALLKQAVIGRAMPQGDILGFAPPLCLTKNEADRVVAATAKAVGEVLED